MNISKIKYIALSAVLCLGFSSCEKFLDRPAEDSYNADNFYQNDDQCVQGVNYLYNSPWYDFQRGFIFVGEVMSGNFTMGNSDPYQSFTVNGTDENLVSMSYSLWAVIGHANTVYNYLKTANASEATKKQCMGECLTWKAMAYFYLVRTFGAVPIVHDNSSMLSDGTYSNVNKVRKEDVYEYIIMTLEEAMKNLEGIKTPGNGRIDYYSAEGLLAKVYLTRSGLGANGKGSRDNDDLAKAAQYAKDVIDNSGRNLLGTYSDVFRMQNNQNEESLISWQWKASRNPWTQQNTLQSDLAMVGFDEFGDCWGGYRGISVDLQNAFGVSALDNPSDRANTDTRRKATIMMAGDTYDYFWTDKGGFDYLKFIYDTEDYGKGGPGECQSSTGANCVKHLYGDTYDHVQATGVSPEEMAYQLATHILRLSDIYLVYAEAVIGNNGSTTDASALKAFNAVRGRAIKGMTPYTSITWEDVWKERRLELALEGDRWYDYVRRSYYDMDGAINELKNQKRNAIYNINSLYKTYYESSYKTWDVSGSDAKYDTDTPAPNVTESVFTLPFPTEDVVFNANLMADPISVDVRSTYTY